MTDKTPVATSGSNRRQNFRIDHALPISIRKLHTPVVPKAHIIPVAAPTQDAADWTAGGLNPAFGEFDSSFALMLIEVNAKIDLLLALQHLNIPAVPDTGPARLSMHQLLLQINLKLEQLLARHKLTRPEERLRVDTVSLSASGVKLMTEEALNVGDRVEVRMLMNVSKPFWIVVGGSVVRATPKPTGKREVAINFSDMDETVSDEISRYALLHQKKQIQARRGFQY